MSAEGTRLKRDNERTTCVHATTFTHSLGALAMHAWCTCTHQSSCISLWMMHVMIVDDCCLFWLKLILPKFFLDFPTCVTGTPLRRKRDVSSEGQRRTDFWIQKKSSAIRQVSFHDDTYKAVCYPFGIDSTLSKCISPFKLNVLFLCGIEKI